MFFDGDGYCMGEKDKEMFEKLKEKHIESVRYPNISRWINYYKKMKI